MRRWLRLAIGGAIVGLAWPLATPALAADPLGQIAEYAIPTAGSTPTEIIAGPDGNLWFTEDVGNKIGRVTTAGAFTEFALSNANSQPLAIAAGPDGNLWFTETNGNRIGEITTGGTITEFSVPTAASQPDDITAGPDGNVWFSEAAGNKIGQITKAGVITEFTVPTASALTAGSGIGAGPDGNLWFTEGSGNNIGRITPAGVITEFPIPTAASRPNKIEPAPDGNMWFTEFNANQIARITTGASNTITEFPVPTANSGPNDLRAGPDANIWFTEYNANVNKVARITMAGTVTEFNVPTSNSQPGGIVSGPDSDMWFTEDNAAKIAKIGVEQGVSATPTVAGVRPNIGPAGGGSSVTVNGTGFIGTGAVRFGPNSAINLVVNSDSQLTVISPGGFGMVDITVTTPSGTSAVTPADQFTYGDTYTAVSTRQFRLVGNDGTSWQDVDPSGGLSLTVAPPPNAHALVSANVDLWTDTRGYNQDIGIYLAESDPATYPGHIVAWKESGGFAGTYSPNAAFVQTLFPLGNATYHFKLQWKANRAAPPNAGIWAGAGPWPATSASFSPTRLTVRLLAGRPAVSTGQHRLSGSNGTDWQDMDLTNLSFTVAPLADSLAIVDASADLWTDTAGYNQDLAITVANMSIAGPDQVMAWKESGGFAGTFSPNAAFVQAVVPMTAGNDYRIKLQWKDNRAAPPSASIFAGAGPWPANSGFYSPTGLTVILLPANGPLSTAVTTMQPLLSGNDGTTWSDIDPALSFIVSPPSNCMAVLTGNADLWTNTAGYNQDIGIYIAEADPTRYPGGIVGWKESGGFAGTFSPNAAFVEAVFPMAGGVSYHVKLKWKDNRGAPASATIVAGAGPWPSAGGTYSPTRLTVGLSCA